MWMAGWNHESIHVFNVAIEPLYLLPLWHQENSYLYCILPDVLKCVLQG